MGKKKEKLLATGSLEAKLHRNPLWDKGNKVCLNGRGHKSKLADMTIYGTTLHKSSSLEQLGLLP